jgi:hypothetical protein
MVLVEIDNEVWALFKKSWALFGTKTHAELVKMLNVDLKETSLNIIEDAKWHLFSDEPEALMLREIGLMEEKRAQ